MLEHQTKEKQGPDRQSYACCLFSGWYDQFPFSWVKHLAGWVHVCEDVFLSSLCKCISVCSILPTHPWTACVYTAQENNAGTCIKAYSASKGSLCFDGLLLSPAFHHLWGAEGDMAEQVGFNSAVPRRSSSCIWGNSYLWLAFASSLCCGQVHFCSTLPFQSSSKFYDCRDHSFLTLTFIC